jgi:tetratricopeptide (TPR) repeat protein
MIGKQVQDLLDMYNIGLKAYKLRKWEEAITAFTRALEINPNDGPSKEYLKRSSEFKQNPPPEDWDGVYVMKTK